MAGGELFEWCAARPLWQQEAIRLLTAKPKLDDEELAQLQRAIKIEAGLLSEKPPTWSALTQIHLKGGNLFAPVTVLGSIGPLRNIDRLAADQPPLKFAIDGVTLIYGANGSGKSGYCRIAKKICHCLHDVTLRGNVFEPQSLDPREITLTFRVDGDMKKRTVVWNDENSPPSELARISVFDSDAAGLYVDSERRIEFLPFELALLTNFADVLRTLDGRFKDEEAQLRKEQQAPLPLGYHENTKVSTILAKLKADQDLPTDESMRELAAWDEEDEGKLEALKIELGKDPLLLTREKQAAKLTLESLVAEANAIIDAIGQAGVASLTAAQRRAADCREAAKAAAAGLSKDFTVPNLGSETWRQMLMYAREFAAEAYPKLDPPQIANADACVLCHQPLDSQARARLAAFDEYIEGRANADAEKAKAEFEEIARAILSLKIPSGQELVIRLVNFVESSAARKAIAQEMATFYEACVERHSLILQAIKTVGYASLAALADLDKSAVDKLSNEVHALAREIEQLEPRTAQTDRHQLCRQESNEWEARKKFSADIETFVARRNSLALLLKTKECAAACAVAAVTAQITRLRRKILTPSLQASLQSEVTALDLEHLPLKLADRGEVGKSKVHIGLEAHQKVSRNSDILSEGEKRALALAGFLAELKELGSRHGIIVDDPVSSLDHSRMEAVAKRLVTEARSGRQVIIFTHNLFFHNAVFEAAQEMKVPLREEWIAKHSDGRFGIIDDSQRPWISMKVNKRLELIDGLLQQRKATYSENDQANRSFVTEIYTKMRETWEHSIEEILFADVVGRLRPNIATLRLRAARVEKADYEAVLAGMTRCSKFSGHDQSVGAPADLPKFDAMKTDLEALRSFIAAANKRKKALEEEGKAFEAGPMMAAVLE